MSLRIRTVVYKQATKLMVLLFLVAPFLVGGESAHGAEILNRSVILGSSVPSVTTNHQVGFDFITAAPAASIVFEYCSNSPLFEVPCTPSSGMDMTAAVLSSESGETGFSVHPSTTSNRLILTRASSVVIPGSSSYLLTNVLNSDTAGSHYVRVSVHTPDDGTGVEIDRGAMAISLNDPVDVGAFVPPLLLLCIGTSIPTNDCSSATGSNIDFGELTSTSTGSDTMQMLAATNGVGGYSITITGTTMTSGNNTIPALATQAASVSGVSQFGLNLRANTSPLLGADVTGPGTGGPSTFYDDINQFRFVDGDTVATSPLSTEVNKYTASYIANIEENQPAGIYSTTLTFIALATF